MGGTGGPGGIAVGRESGEIAHLLGRILRVRCFRRGCRRLLLEEAPDVQWSQWSRVAAATLPIWTSRRSDGTVCNGCPVRASKKKHAESRSCNPPDLDLLICSGPMMHNEMVPGDGTRKLLFRRLRGSPHKLSVWNTTLRVPLGDEIDDCAALGDEIDGETTGSVVNHRQLTP